MCVLFVSAQTTYKQVTLDRGTDSETNCIYVYNDNYDSVHVVIQYKIGNRETDWIDYPVPYLIPPSIEPQKIGCVDSVIIGLKLVDVVVVRNQYDSDSPKSNKSTIHSFGFLNKLISKIKSIFL